MTTLMLSLLPTYDDDRDDEDIDDDVACGMTAMLQRLLQRSSNSELAMSK